MTVIKSNITIEGYDKMVVLRIDMGDKVPHTRDSVGLNLGIKEAFKDKDGATFHGNVCFIGCKPYAVILFEKHLELDPAANN